ncbi:hypothetical protein BGZ92_007805 [Podila epicladia]|nr:hypothetical protein BGZ92_007805 [Podila epicladia]
MNIRDQERHLQLVATPSRSIAAVMSQEPHRGETHGQGAQSPWVETPDPAAPSKNKNKNRKKYQNQKKKAPSQENKDASDLIETVTNKLSDMSTQPSQNDHRHKKVYDNITNTNNADNKPHNHKNNKRNNHTIISGTSTSSNNKSKGTKQHKKEKESDVDRDSPILQIENFPPLSASHLPTTSYTQVQHQDSSAKWPQTAKKTRWQPLVYEAITKTQKKPYNPKERVLHVVGVAE